MNLFNYEAIIFDLDGTLLNSSKDVMLCLEEAFDFVGLDIDKSKLNSNIIGPPLNKMTQAVLPEITESQINLVVNKYNEIYDSGKYNSSKLYDGIYDLLLSLKEEGKELFIATNKPIVSTLKLVEKFKLDMFKEIYAFDMEKDKIISKSKMVSDIILKNGLDINKTVMIGDALGDMTAAKENKITAVGALWGYGDNKEPLIKKADIVFESASNLLLNLKKETV